MPRGFNRAYIDRLKHEVPISFVISQAYLMPVRISDIFTDEEAVEYGVRRVHLALLPERKLGKSRGRWIGISPFSVEKTPSFTVLDDRRMYKCFSTQKAGDVFTFFMEVKRMSFPEAVSFVQAIATDDRPYERRPRRTPRKKVSRNKKRAMKRGGP
jgi:hypothetical protein